MSATTWQPTGDRVLVKRLAEEEKTAGGLFIPTAAKEKPQRASVVAVGPDATRVRPGDLVLFGKYSGSEINVDHEDMVVLRDDEIMLVKRAAADSPASSAA